MQELIIKRGDNPPEKVPLNRLRITIGRSTRSDICIPDPFASRVHAEIRKQGEVFFLQDLGSANGTRYNGNPAVGTVKLLNGDEIQIGETVIVYSDGSQSLLNKPTTLVTDTTDDFNPAITIALTGPKNFTSDLFRSIESKKADQFGLQIPDKHEELLTLISKVGVTLLASVTLDETLNQVADLVFQAVPAERCVIMLKDETSEEKNECDVAMKISVARLREKSDDFGEIRVSRNVMQEVVQKGNSVLTSDAQHDPRFASQTISLQGIRSVLAVPLQVKDQVFGLIYADSPVATANFTEEHLKVLTTLASVASIRVENAKLLEERLERERLERELQLASEIQQRFQPSSPPMVEGYEMQGISFSCYEVGGDYYDFIPRQNGKMLIALGDVSGKGTAAALLMSSLHAAVHAQASANADLLNLTRDVNQYLAHNTPANRFVTLFMAELDPLTGSISFVNAGHNPPLIAHADGTIEQLASGGFPLGILPNVEYDLGQTILEPGDVLVIYSDGVSETANPEGEEFGIERLEAVLRQHITASAARLRDRVENALSSFADSEPAADDITLVIVKRQAQRAEAVTGRIST
jgi:serine phosphatase RsbU (regulator of sigma subunit)